MNIGKIFSIAGKILKPVLPLLPNAVKKIVRATDGNKTITGAAVTGLALICLAIPGGQGIGLQLSMVGVPILLTGLGHKLYKRLANKGKKEVIIMAGKFGIQQTKEVIDFGVAAANVVTKQLADGFQPIEDGIAMIPVVTKLPAAIADIDEVPAELGDMQDEEFQELQESVRALDVPDDAVEELTECYMMAGLWLSKAIAKTAEAKKRKQP